jgi:hypothetical protein
MSDQYDALISGAPTDKETQLALAAQLRRQAQLGELYGMTGDRVLAPAGKEMMSGAMSGAQDISSERARAAQLAQEADQQRIANARNQANDTWTHTHGDAELAEQKAGLAQAMQIAKMADQRQRDIDAANNAEKLQAKQPTGDGKPLPAAVTKILDAKRDVLDDISNAANNFKPEYAGAAQGFKNWEGTHSALMPWSVDPNTKAGANWWQQYGRNFTLDEMHAKFGARVSPTEMALFEKYHISPGMDADTIKNNITQIRDALAKHYGNELDVQDAPNIYSKAEINAYRRSLPGAAVAAPQPQPLPGAPAAPGFTHPDAYSPEAKAKVLSDMERLRKQVAQPQPPPTSMNFPQAAAQPPQALPASLYGGLPMGNPNG